MNFPKFTAYFNQPISTTPSFNVAKKFADQAGIILTLKAGVDDVEPPKFLSVKWLSAYQGTVIFLQ